MTAFKSSVKLERNHEGKIKLIERAQRWFESEGDEVCMKTEHHGGHDCRHVLLSGTRP